MAFADFAAFDDLGDTLLCARALCVSLLEKRQLWLL